MTKTSKAGRTASAPAGATPATAALVPPPHPPVWFRLLRWTSFCATVGIAIGMLALMNQQLTGISWVYDGQVKQYLGRSIRISYCMFSASTDADAETRCNFGFAVASVSLVLSFIWSYLQALRRNPFKNPATKLVDLALCGTWLVFWGAAAVVLCIWTDEANKAGSFLSSARDARNGFCVMAWLQFLLVLVLTATAALLFTKKCQSVFDKWDAKHRQKKYQQEQMRLQGQLAKVSQQEAAAAAAAAAAAQQKPAAVGAAAGPPAAHAAGGSTAAPQQAAARAGGGHATASAADTTPGAAPLRGPEVGTAATTGSQAAGSSVGVPVSSPLRGSTQGADTVPGPADAKLPLKDDNPFRSA